MVWNEFFCLLWQQPFVVLLLIHLQSGVDDKLSEHYHIVNRKDYVFFSFLTIPVITFIHCGNLIPTHCHGPLSSMLLLRYSFVKVPGNAARYPVVTRSPQWMFCSLVYNTYGEHMPLNSMVFSFISHNLLVVPIYCNKAALSQKIAQSTLYWAHLCNLYGGPICIAFCPSARLSGLDQKSD